MRNFNHIYKNNSTLVSFIHDNGIKNSQSLLIRVHSAAHSLTEMESLIACIRSELPDARFIGCSTSHIILSGETIHGACLISFTEFEGATILTERLSCVDNEGQNLKGQELATKMLANLPKGDREAFVMVFFPLSYTRIEAFVDTVNNSGRHIKMLGGTAYLESETEDNPCYVISGGKASARDMGYAYIVAPKLLLNTDYACGVEPVGKKCKIKVEGTIVRSVDDMPGGEWYSELLGKAELDKNPQISDSFPLVMRDGSNVPFHVEYKKSPETGEYIIETFPELRNGINVSPGYFHPQKTYDQVVSVIKAVSENPCQAIFGYDCYARNSLLSDCAKWELSTFGSTDIAGCLLSGEISHKGGRNLYANLSFVMASLSEDEGARVEVEEPDVAAIAILQEENVKSLNFLLYNAMQSMSQELVTQRDMLKDAVFFNPAVGMDNQLKFQYESKTESLDKVAVFYLNNEKMLRLFSGVSETYASLTACYEDVIHRFSDYNLYFYSYQETSLMVAANDQTACDDFEQIVDDIQDYLNTKVYCDIRLSYLAVAIQGGEDPLSALELALEYARNHKLSRIRSKDVESDIEHEQEKLRILWVVREALTHRRVVPYFQEIHSNRAGESRFFEALMRITDDKGKLYFPDTFLPIAKEYSLYDKLSELMISTVMDMFRDRDARVTLNLNVNDIYNRHMIKMIFEKLARSPHPENFVFEIVESEEVTDYEYIESFADRIHEHGSLIAIDDFGSGFSNMLHLLRIDADFIKIDGAIIKEIVHDAHVREFVKFMQNWCETNDKSLICEFIENKEIQDIMEEYGVAYSQGYYYSKPHPWGPEDE